MRHRTLENWRRVRTGSRENLLQTVQAPDPGPAGRLGLEAEYRILEDGTQVDFAGIICALAKRSPVPLRRERASGFRLPDGHLLLCDGAEAEIATPPERLAADAPGRLAVSLYRAQNLLVDLLERHSAATGRHYTIRGRSCHFNIHTLRSADEDGFVRRFALTHGPLLLLLTCLPSTLSVVFRLRPHRLEVITEYVSDPERLRATITAVASCFQQAFARESGQAPMDLPQLRPECLSPYPIRTGWRLSLEAAGSRLRAGKRLGLVDGMEGTAPISLQAWIERGWQAVRPYAENHFDAAETRRVERYVAGSRPGAIELGTGDHLAVGRVKLDGRADPPVHPFAAAIRNRRIGRWSLAPAFVHWDFIVYACRSGRAQFFVNLPARFLPEFLAGKWHRTLAAALDQSAAAPAPDGTQASLADPASASEPGLFQAVDATALARGLGQIPAGKKKKPPRRRPKEDICAVAAKRDGTYEIFLPRTMDPQQLRPGVIQEPPRNDTQVARGVWIHNQTFNHSHLDHHVNSVGFDFAFRRYYRSGIDYDGVLGQGWDHGYNLRVVPQPGSRYRAVPGGWAELYAPNSRGGNLTYYHGTGRITGHAFRAWEIRSVSWCDARLKAIVTTYD
ncbi:MAG: DUF6531 domain-containing protein, partial [Opitutaceae bacterium]